MALDTGGEGLPRERGGSSPSIRLAPVAGVRQVFGRFWPYARPHRMLIAIALGFAVVSPLIAAVSIGFFKVLVDRVLVPRDLAAFWWVALGYAGLTLLAGAVGFGRRYVGALAGERFVFDLRQLLFDRLQALSLAFFERRQLGDVLARITGDVTAIERLVVSGVFRALSYVLRILFFTAALFWLQWDLALVSLVALPLFAMAARWFSVRIKAATREQKRRSGALSAVVEESLANIPLVQAYNRQGGESDRLWTQNRARFRAKMSATRLRAAFVPLVDGIELIGTLLVAGLGTYELAQGSLSLGGLLAFAAYVTQLYSPVRRLGGLVNTAYAASASAERVLEILDERPAIVEAPAARSLTRPRGRVEFDRVSFTYPGTDHPVLRDVSFRADPGQVVAIVGASGAGKSSLTKLLLRFYDPDAGTIRLDGHDLRELTLASLRDNLAVLLQESLVLDASIRDNIALGRPTAPDREIARVAEAAGVDSFARRLPDGLDSEVGQRGRLLSGGQRQRVAIARAMLRDAPVLVLDEPTAGLDGASGHRVLGPLRRLLRDRTALVISHDLGTVREADTILVLDGGRVVERGDHASLLRRDGRYARLYEAYACAGIDPVLEGSTR